ncbi:CRISPR-associated protein Csx15 [Fodinisporobacter ferrooxydans]|uniref:CRISPR-associated protein Csx15 n=1 Tax=Fodinisporobacter ferrooxydans TaxID=2901836 RepID=UPI003D317893
MVTIALPGMSALAQVVIIKLHAMSGIFPLVTLPLRDKSKGGKFVWQRPVDLHHVRN